MKILDAKLVRKGSLVATFGVCVPKWGGFILRKVTFYQKGGQEWVCLPAESYEKDGKKCYYPLNTFEDKKTEEAFKDKVRELIKEWINQQGQDANY